MAAAKSLPGPRRAGKWHVRSLAFAVAVLLSIASAHACADASADEYLCGPKCLLMICRQFGASASLNELAQLCQASTDKGTTLYDLSSAAQRKGLKTAAVKMSATQLASLSIPAIAHLWGGHFVLVEPGASGQLNVIDGSPPAITVSTESFAGHYSGFALLVAKSPESLPSPRPVGPDLRLSEYRHDFGFVDPGTIAESKVTLRNAGNEECVVSSVSASCGCAVAHPSTFSIPIGGSMNLTILTDTSSRSGPQSIWVYISSDDPITPRVQLEIVGGVRRDDLLYAPAALAFGNAARGEGATLHVHIPDSSFSSPNYSAQPLKITSVSSDNR